MNSHSFINYVPLIYFYPLDERKKREQKDLKITKCCDIFESFVVHMFV
jgi:hypothetical protein